MDDGVTIRLTEMTGFGHHGVLDEERRIGQRFVVGVELHLASERSGTTDDLGDTVDYRRIAEIVEEILEGEPVDLLERLGTIIADTLLSEPDVASVAVTVEKPGLTLPLDAKAAVTVRKSR